MIYRAAIRFTEGLTIWRASPRRGVKLLGKLFCCAIALSLPRFGGGTALPYPRRVPFLWACFDDHDSGAIYLSFHPRGAFGESIGFCVRGCFSYSRRASRLFLLGHWCALPAPFGYDARGGTELLGSRHFSLLGVLHACSCSRRVRSTLDGVDAARWGETELFSSRRLRSTRRASRQFLLQRSHAEAWPLLVQCSGGN